MAYNFKMNRHRGIAIIFNQCNFDLHLSQRYSLHLFFLKHVRHNLFSSTGTEQDLKKIKHIYSSLEGGEEEGEPKEEECG